MTRVCLQCGKGLNQYHTGELCYACQEKQLDKMIVDREELVDAEGYAVMLGLDSAEQLKRLARDGMLAPSIPVIRKWLWRKVDIEDWFKQKQRAGDVFRKTAMEIASNLRRCSNDSIIYALSDTIGRNVYGQEYVLATVDAGRVEPIKLVEVDKSVALQVLEELPEKDFPELTGITDWEDLPYDRINEDLIVRLEAYF